MDIIDFKEKICENCISKKCNNKILTRTEMLAQQNGISVLFCKNYQPSLDILSKKDQRLRLIFKKKGK